MLISGLCCGIDPEATSGGAVHERELQIALSPLAESTILLARGKPYPSQLAERVVLTVPAHGQRWPVMATAGAAQLLRWARRHRPSVLRAHSILGPGLAALLVRRATGIPVVVHVHHIEPHDPLWPLRRAIIRRADWITVLSRFTEEQVRRRCTIVGAGVHLPSPVSGRAESPVVLFVGELKRRKRVDFLLRAWSTVHRHLPHAQCWIVGDGPERRTLHLLAERLDIKESVWFFGRVPEVDKPRYFDAAWTFAFPSELEGFGMPVIEAMAHGLAVVTSGAAALAEIRGTIVSPLRAGPEAFGAALVENLKTARREEADVRNRAHAATYPWRCVAERTVAACVATLA